MGKKAQPPPPPPEPVEKEEPKEEEEAPPEVQEGDFSLLDGSSYSGEYIVRQERPLMHGTGTLQMPPESFEGTFHEGLYKEGTFKGADGSVYTGSFHNSLFHGPGDYAWPDGRIFRGMWQGGLMHGRGEFENFSFGVDRLFTGFSVCGGFTSSLKGQEEAKRAFLAEYSDAYGQSARAALQDFASKITPPEPADPKAKKGAPVDEPPFEWPKEYMVPAEGAEGAEEPALAEERSAVEEAVAGPFPDEKALKPASLLAFAAALAEGAADPGDVTVLEERGQQLGGFDGGRAKCEQLSYAGQVVALGVPNAEPGAVKLLVWANVSKEYHVAAAKWKLIFCEEAAGTAEEVPAPAAVEEKKPDPKGKKK